MLRVRYQIFLACFIIIAFFMPSITAEVSVIDDYTMINSLMNEDNFSIRSIFIPETSKGGYYRPLIMLSYYLDKHLWLMSSSFMHLENIILHLVNVLLVFALMRRLIPLEKRDVSYAPLLCSLLFGLHPLVTESVNWISGRTDPLACIFVLSSAFMLVIYREHHKLNYLITAAFLLLFGMLSKETSFGFVFGAFFILFSNKHNERQIIGRDLLKILLFIIVAIYCALFVYNYWYVMAIGATYLVLLYKRERLTSETPNGIRKALFATFIIICVALIVLKLRSLAYTSNLDRIGNTIKLIFCDTSYSISVFLGAAGFYMKKYFFPLPLNFAIREIDPLYDFAGIALFFASLFQLHRRSIASGLFLAGTSMLLPSLLFAFGTIAWTGYAERYVYISCAFWSIAITYVIAMRFDYRSVSPKLRFLVVSIIASIVVFIGTVTYARNCLWQTNLGLIEATVKESPDFRLLRGLYMTAFLMKGDIAGAKHQYAVANSLNSTVYQEEFDLMMASILFSEGKSDEAIKLCKYVVKRQRGSSISAYEMLIKFYEQLLKRCPGAPQANEWRAELFDFFEKLHALNKNPYLMYKMGQLAISVDDRDKALCYFNSAQKEFPAENEFKDYSKKIVQRLEKNIKTSRSGL